MTAAGWVALAIAVFGAFAYAAGSILQAVGARRSSGTVRTLGHPLYLIGVVFDMLAWAGSMVALRELAVYLVESVLAGSLALTIVAARVILKSRLRSRDVFAITISVAALTALAMSAGPQESVVASDTFRFWFCAAAVITALIGWGTAKVGSPGVVAGVAGLSLGGAALAGRALILPPQPMEHPGAAAMSVVTEPLAAALIVFAATGMLLYTHSLQHGQVGPVTAVLWIAEVVAPSAVALLLLGDSVRPGWDMTAAVAGLVTVGAAVVLATAPANEATARAQAAGPQAAGPQAAGAQAARAQEARRKAARRKATRPAAPARPALPAAPARRTVGVARRAERIIWWGPPPIWRPPDRAPAVPVACPSAGRPLAGASAAQLTWSPPPGEARFRGEPHPADADTVEPPSHVRSPRPWPPIPRQPFPAHPIMTEPILTEPIPTWSEAGF